MDFGYCGPTRGTDSFCTLRWCSVGICWPGMTWLGWLGVVVVLVALAAVTGVKPKGTRHVARTRLMGGARLALLAIVIIAAYLAYRARSGG